MNYMIGINVSNWSAKPNINKNWNIPVHIFINSLKMLLFSPIHTPTPTTTSTHPIYMHIPFLKGFVHHHQPPFLGLQGTHMAFGANVGVWALSVPVLLPTACKCTSSAPWGQTLIWGAGPRVLHPDVPPNLMECTSSRQPLGRLLCPDKQ